MFFLERQTYANIEYIVVEQNPKDPYGLSKIQAEHIVLDWYQNNKVVYTIFRLLLLVGINPPGNLGAMIQAIKKRV